VTLYPGRFEGRTAIVTGGATGLGREVARRIVAEGGRVVLWDLQADWANEAKEDVGAVAAIAFSVADNDAVQRATEESAALLGHIDILVNSAGITGATAPVDTYPVDSWLSVIDVNLNGLFYCCRAVVPHMVANGYGRIVNVASVAGKEGNPNASAYSASKAGVIGLTKSLGKELAQNNICVNCITPAVIETDILKQITPEHVTYMLSKIPMNRFGKVDEAAALVAWLCSADCSFSTGGVFDLSGGRATY